MNLASLVLFLLSLLTLLGSVVSLNIPAEDLKPDDSLAPLYVPGTEPQNLVQNSYIVVFWDDASESHLQDHLRSLGVFLAHNRLEGGSNSITDVWDSFLISYASVLSPEALKFVRGRPEVKYVEQNQMGYLQTMKQQYNPPCGLARISRHGRLNLTRIPVYDYDVRAGEGVDVYVVDSGVEIDHPQFSGRASWGQTIVKNSSDSDKVGHGTHCAGVIAAKTYGVAKGANIISVKVADKDIGFEAIDLYNGVRWAALNAAAKRTTALQELREYGRTEHKGSVINLSLGIAASSVMNDLIDQVINVTGVHVVVAAGNEWKDACEFSTGSSKYTITVGASTVTDERAWFSNYGKCVDIFAPGMDIESTYIGGGNATRFLSGTSQAAPYVAGLAAYLLSCLPPSNPVDISGCTPVVGRRHLSIFTMSVFSDTVDGILPQWLMSFFLHSSTGQECKQVAESPHAPAFVTPEELKSTILKLATAGLLDGLTGGSPNLLAYNGGTRLR